MEAFILNCARSLRARARLTCFTVFALTWSVFVESLKIKVFSGLEKKILQPEHICYSLLWLVLP